MKLLCIVLLALGMSGCSGCAKSSDDEQVDAASQPVKVGAPSDSTVMVNGKPMKVLGTVPRDRRFDHGPNRNPK